MSSSNRRESLEQTLTLISRSIAAFTSASGLSVLAGWALGIGALKSVHPRWATMKANAAFAFVLSGIVLWVLAGASRGGASPLPARRSVAFASVSRAGAALLVLIALLTAGEYLFHWDLGIDQLMVRDAAPASFPGRMAPVTALNFFLLGAAFLIIDLEILNLRRAAQWLALVVLVDSFAAVLGYAYGVQSLYRVGGYSSMSLHTALLFIMISIGFLCARPGWGLMSLATDTGASGWIFRRYLPATIFLVPLLWWLRSLGERAGFYGFELGMALFVVINIVISSALVWWATSFVRAESSRRAETEARFGLMANAAPVLIWGSGPDKLCTFFNQPWLDFRGRPVEQELGNGWAEGVHPDDVAQCMKIYVECFDARRPFSMEYRLRRHDGEYRWILDKGVPHYDPHGNFQGYIGSCVDFTERKLAEAEALRRQTELAHVARVSTMGELVASIAHELNQPLGAIQTNAAAAELLLDRNPPDLKDLRAILADIRKDDLRASEVIRRIHAMLRKDEREWQPLNVNSVVEDVLRIIRSEAVMRKTVITTDLRGVPLIQGDEIQLQQVLVNLVINGIEAMANEPPEKRELTVRTACNGENMVEVAVVDSGPGIPPDKLPLVFEPFFTTKANGLGMGLSITRTIIETHRGRVSAENNQAGGATFRFALPATNGGCARVNRKS